MKASTALRTLTNLVDDFNCQMMDLGAGVRSKVIKPLCKEHKLKFWSGNGDYWFEIVGRTGMDRRIGSKADARDEGMDYLLEVFDLLDSEVAYGQPFGYFVEGVTS